MNNIINVGDMVTFVSDPHKPWGARNIAKCIKLGLDIRQPQEVSYVKSKYVWLVCGQGEGFNKACFERIEHVEKCPFKVGDKIKFKYGAFSPVPIHNTSNDVLVRADGLDINAVYKVSEIRHHGVMPGEWVSTGMIRLNGGKHWYNALRFEAVTEPPVVETKAREPQRGDVWGSEDSTRIVRVISRYLDYSGNPTVAYEYLHHPRIPKGYVGQDLIERFLLSFPVLKSGKKTPKPAKVKASRKVKEWRPLRKEALGFVVELSVSGTDMQARCCDSYGYAHLKKGDTFSSEKGKEIASLKAIRARINAELDELCK